MTRRIPSKPKGKYKSTFEWTVARNLGKLKVKYEYEPEELPYKEMIPRTYLPDFRLRKKMSGFMYIETKGYLSPDDRRKMRNVKFYYPDLDIRIVFQVDNWLNKKKKTRYSDWARKNNFKFFVGETIPEDWIKELR